MLTGKIEITETSTEIVLFKDEVLITDEHEKLILLRNLINFTVDNYERKVQSDYVKEIPKL